MFTASPFWSGLREHFATILFHCFTFPFCQVFFIVTTFTSLLLNAIRYDNKGHYATYSLGLFYCCRLEFYWFFRFRLPKLLRYYYRILQSKNRWFSELPIEERNRQRRKAQENQMVTGHKFHKLRTRYAPKRGVSLSKSMRKRAMGYGVNEKRAHIFRQFRKSIIFCP